MSSNIRGSWIGAGAVEVLNMATIDSFLTNQMNLGAQEFMRHHETCGGYRWYPPQCRNSYTSIGGQWQHRSLYFCPRTSAEQFAVAGGEKESGLGCTWGKISYQVQDQFLGCLRLAMQAVSFLRCTKSPKSSALANAPSYYYSKGLCVQGI